MKELDFIKIIKEQTTSDFIGDDCAYLKEFGITVSQDNFVEDVHFKKDWATPFQIGYKAAAVNISDILASGAKPVYLTVGLSVPKEIDEEFIKELYSGIQKGSYGAKVIGGDITNGEKIFISITAIGATENRKISSRSSAKVGYVVITHGKYGQSSKGLEALMTGIEDSENIKAHLEPILEPNFSENISKNIDVDYAMMDTSDGLADALFKIAQASGGSIVAENIEGMFGAEDYHLVAAVPKNILPKLNDYYIIGKVIEKQDYAIKIGVNEYKDYEELGLFNHFSK